MKMRTSFVIALAVAAATHAASAQQSAADHVAIGDKEHAANNASAALKHYEAALTVDASNYEALWKASREAVDLGEFNPSEAERKTLFKNAEGYARRAMAANPNDAEGHFQVARAVGKNALTMGTKDKIKFAGEVREHALAALKLNPKHAGALHIMGKWNLEIMSLNAVSRAIAKSFLGGKVFGEANWPSAQRYMEEATAIEPNRITHHLDLARVYAGRDMNAKAREQFEWIAKAPPVDFNDRHYKQEAEKEAKSVR